MFNLNQSLTAIVHLNDHNLGLNFSSGGKFIKNFSTTFGKTIRDAIKLSAVEDKNRSTYRSFTRFVKEEASGYFIFNLNQEVGFGYITKDNSKLVIGLKVNGQIKTIESFECEVNEKTVNFRLIKGQSSEIASSFKETFDIKEDKICQTECSEIAELKAMMLQMKAELDEVKKENELIKTKFNELVDFVSKTETQVEVEEVEVTPTHTADNIDLEMFKEYQTGIIDTQWLSTAQVSLSALKDLCNCSKVQKDRHFGSKKPLLPAEKIENLLQKYKTVTIKFNNQIKHVFHS